MEKMYKKKRIMEKSIKKRGKRPLVYSREFFIRNHTPYSLYILNSPECVYTVSHKSTTARNSSFTTAHKHCEFKTLFGVHQCDSNFMTTIYIIHFEANISQSTVIVFKNIYYIHKPSWIDASYNQKTCLTRF